MGILRVTTIPSNIHTPMKRLKEFLADAVLVLDKLEHMFVKLAGLVLLLLLLYKICCDHQ